MKQYTIQEVSSMLKVSKDTLRYYEKIGLVEPSRGSNHYRYYTEENVLELQYIEVMKYAHFTLGEIRMFFVYRKSCGIDGDGKEITQLFQDKKTEFQ